MSNCVQCRMGKCHNCSATVTPTESRWLTNGRFWFPHCMGGAVAGDSSGRTCWPTTERQASEDKAQRTREFQRSVRMYRTNTDFVKLTRPSLRPLRILRAVNEP